jgi:hypothetical protein
LFKRDKRTARYTYHLKSPAPNGSGGFQTVDKFGRKKIKNITEEIMVIISRQKRAKDSGPFRTLFIEKLKTPAPNGNGEF